jgi:hypothetical protein
LRFPEAQKPKGIEGPNIRKQAQSSLLVFTGTPVGAPTGVF